jgi:hypothetical protein
MSSGGLITGDCFDADVCVMAANCPFIRDCRMVEDVTTATELHERAASLARSTPYSHHDCLAALTLIGDRPGGDAVLEAALYSAGWYGRLEDHVRAILHVIKVYAR